MDRIDFLRKVAAGGSLLLIAPAFMTSCSKDDDMTDPGNGGGNEGITIDLTDSAFDALDTVGGYAYSGSLIIFRTGTDNYMALSRKCTHQGCDVTYSHANGNIPCPCHGSMYTTSGVVTNGPAMANLKSYTVTKSGNTLTIK
ncbi:ubiquinol-cytochrome c reductase iron-sulfur subunit [Maribellus sediminis]|uniref:QcrA and Rieske domain-containing protein n=1 Tax=Maribellus sediminis TaxID=2696285 RepID=UPI0014308ECE|nr:Rieske (2Fe-2S) protein [Maribellus sediminis]